ncbi:MAG: hypothetical protein AAB734_03255 [Patescibacteria group bacterium]
MAMGTLHMFSSKKHLFEHGDRDYLKIKVVIPTSEDVAQLRESIVRSKRRLIHDLIELADMEIRFTNKGVFLPREVRRSMIRTRINTQLDLLPRFAEIEYDAAFNALIAI